MQMEDIQFLIIGATKSATTWLQKCLQSDPHVCMPDPELHYFSRKYDRGDEWYLAQFPSCDHTRLIGEKSNSYLDMPDAALRIRSALPHVKLIAQLRNPVDRAYSDYCMLLRRGDVTRDIGAYLDPRSSSDGRFLAGGLYYRQMRSYIDRFGAEQLLVVFYEDIEQSPARHLSSVRSFLKLLESGAVPLTSKVKDREAPVVGRTLRRILRPLKPVVAPIRNHRYFDMIHRSVARPMQYPPLTSDLRQRMVEFYAADVGELGRTVGCDLSSWLTDGRSPGDAPARVQGMKVPQAATGM